MPRSTDPVTPEEARKIEERCGPNARAVLAALRDLGEPSTTADLLQRVSDRGEWESPGAPAAYVDRCRKDGKPITPAMLGLPYKGIISQHLNNFVKRGLIEVVGRRGGHQGHPFNLYAAVAVPGHDPDQTELEVGERPMRARAQEALDLKAQDVSVKEIAERMGISRSYAYELIDDPTGAKSLARKEKLKCTTPGCERNSRGERRCNGCKRMIDELMPSCRIERWARAVARERRLTINFLLVETEKKTEPFRRVVEVTTTRGTVERTLKKGDTWTDALGACGIEAE